MMTLRTGCVLLPSMPSPPLEARGGCAGNFGLFDRCTPMEGRATCAIPQTWSSERVQRRQASDLSGAARNTLRLRYRGQSWRLPATKTQLQHPLQPAACARVAPRSLSAVSCRWTCQGTQGRLGVPRWKGRGSTKVPPRSPATRPHRWALAAAERRFHDARRVHRNKHICVGAAGKGGLGQLLVEFLQCGKSRLVQHAAAPEQLAPVRAILRGPHRTGTCLCVSSSHRDAATVAVVLASLRHGALLSVGHHGQDGALFKGSVSLPPWRIPRGE
eukprot:scaffold12304_cov121-Isochrysis_galbana.AAC.8